MSGEAQLIRALKMLADEVQSLAFQMPAPNEFTPQFVMLAQFARDVAIRAEMAKVEQAPEGLA